MNKIVLVLLAFFLVWPVTQGQEIDFSKSFGTEYDFRFLEGLSPKIEEAVVNQNALALGAYAALFFYAENFSSKKIPELTGLDLLEKATQIALLQEDKKALLPLSQIWEENYFGAGNPAIAEKLRKGNIGIKVLPAYQQILAGERVVFRVVKDISLVNLTEIDIPLDQISFFAKEGKFSYNEYEAPQYPCNIMIGIQYRPTKQTAYAVLVVKAMEEKNTKNDAKNSDSKRMISETQRKKKLQEFFAKKTRRENVAAIKFFADRPQILQKVLSQSEAAKVNALEKLVKTIEKIVDLFPEIVSLPGANHLISNDSIWAGVKTGEAYVYPQDPYSVRVMASVPSEWIIESLYRTWKKQNRNAEKSKLDPIKEVLPPVLEEEGSVPLE